MADPLDKTVMASDLHGEEVLTETDSDGETTKATKARARALQAVRRRRRELLDEFKTTDEVLYLSFLEWAAVKPATTAKYREVVLRFLELAATDGPIEEDAAVDAALVQFMNHCFGLGEPANIGETLLAGLCHMAPEFSKHGPRR